MDIQGASYDEWHNLEQPTIAQVRIWLQEATKFSPDKAGAQIAALLKDPAGLSFAVAFVDGVIRPEDYAAAGKNLVRISRNLPRFLSLWQRLAIIFGARLAVIAPGIVIPIARKVLRYFIGHLIIDAREKKLTYYLRKLRADSGARLNINLLGEMILGQKEADKRIQRCLDLLARDDVDYISIKVSSLLAPQAPWAFDDAVQKAKDHLRPLFLRAMEYSPHKFINIDMEEYHDLHLTIQVFTQLLDDPQFHNLYAGIVLQAYLPDALEAMIKLQKWAAARVRLGGSIIKVRLVKGANLPMEKVQSALYSWPLATFSIKEETDTNYIRIIEYALRPENITNIRLGIAGHNLFDIAFSWLLARYRGVTGQIEYEMLLGMAQNQAEAMKKDIGSLVLYTPVVHPEEFDVAITYLVRRLEEGASKENFMSAIFELDNNTELFAREEGRFIRSLRALTSHSVLDPHRDQDRNQPPIHTKSRESFVNAIDSDPATEGNISWSKDITAYMSGSRLGFAYVKEAIISTSAQLDLILDTAVQGSQIWQKKYSMVQRRETLNKIAVLLEEHRSAFIEVMGDEAGKTLDQSDPELSEAIDFARYYACRCYELDNIDGAQHIPDRVVCVTPPWNFPVAIPAGLIFAALAAGSAVILKPSELAPRCSALLTQLLWDAGVPKEVLQFIVIDEQQLGKTLIEDKRIDKVVLTGAYETAQLFRSWRSDLSILAETSGKNTMIITPYADYDLAVRDLVHSAFSHAGQKCSAVSLAILVGSVGGSQRFMNQLSDAVSSLIVGYPWNLSSRMGPLIGPPSGKLHRGLTQLDAGEQWLIEPRRLDDSGKLWSPGIKKGVRPGSFFHNTELFGPVLGIMHARNLNEAIEIHNAIEYQLTAGLHSLDPSEIKYWINRIHAGNLYVNRGTTGAIVQRQPFGGWKKSVVGAGYKAGGPNYLLGFGNWVPKKHHDSHADTLEDFHYGLIQCIDSKRDRKWLEKSFASDRYHWWSTYSQVVDTANLGVEQNLFRYLSEPVHIRLMSSGSIVDFLRIFGAGIITSVKLSVSLFEEPSQQVRKLLDTYTTKWDIVKDSNWLRIGMSTFGNGRIRIIGADSDLIANCYAAYPHSTLYYQHVTGSGRLELLPFLKEQSISITAHRFGNKVPPIIL